MGIGGIGRESSNPKTGFVRARMCQRLGNSLVQPSICDYPIIATLMCEWERFAATTGKKVWSPGPYTLTPAKYLIGVLASSLLLSPFRPAKKLMANKWTHDLLARTHIGDGSSYLRNHDILRNHPALTSHDWVPPGFPRCFLTNLAAGCDGCIANGRVNFCAAASRLPGRGSWSLRPRVGLMILLDFFWLSESWKGSTYHFIFTSFWFIFIT